jgi:tetratricopeptide (TPR) repeat protein
LRATIEWSHELLTPEEQRLFARLAVFRGGCMLETAEEIADADLDTLRSLVDKSLLRHTGERYWMLETIREYAVERLDASVETDELHRRHADHFLALAEHAESHVREYSMDWLDRLEREHDNLRSALDWLESSGQGELVSRLGGALADFWGIRGHFAEAQRRLTAALAAHERPTSARAKALIGAADVAAGGDIASARRWAEEALSISRALGDARGIASALLMLGSTYENVDWHRARDLWEESVRLFREADDQHQALFAARLLAWSYAELGDVEHARALHEDNLREARAAGNAHMEAQSLEALAFMAVDEGRPLDAVPMLEDALRIHCALRDPFRIAVAVGRFAGVLASARSPGPAAVLLSCSDALLDEIGASGVPWVTRMLGETRAAVGAQLDDVAFGQAWEQGRKLSADEAVALALDSLS